jgi:hypothetical protein
MKPEYFEQSVRWFREERETFQSAGVSAKILQEASSLQFVLNAVVAKHLAEIQSDPDFVNEIPQGAVTQQGALTITRVFERFCPCPQTNYRISTASCKA